MCVDVCVCVFAHVLLICAYVYLLFVYLYCNIVYTQRMPETGVPLMQTKPTACQPVPRVLVCVCVCVYTKYHSRYHWHQTRAPQPASLGILINYNSNNVAWNVVNTVQKVAKNLFALLRCRWQSTVILFVIRHLNTLLDLVIRLGVVAFALPWGSWF